MFCAGQRAPWGTSMAGLHRAVTERPVDSRHGHAAPGMAALTRAAPGTRGAVLPIGLIFVADSLQPYLCLHSHCYTSTWRTRGGIARLAEHLLTNAAHLVVTRLCSLSVYDTGSCACPGKGQFSCQLCRRNALVRRLDQPKRRRGDRGPTEMGQQVQRHCGIQSESSRPGRGLATGRR
jgi:hypothetical protein